MNAIVKVLLSVLKILSKCRVCKSSCCETSCECVNNDDVAEQVENEVVAQKQQNLNETIIH
jgi:hypothetical protein